MSVKYFKSRENSIIHSAKLKCISVNCGRKKSEKYTSFDTLIGFAMFWFAKCQNEKCRQKTQNRASAGTFFGMFRDKNSIYDVKA